MSLTTVQLAGLVPTEVKENPYGPPFNQIGVYCQHHGEIGSLIQTFTQLDFGDWTYDVAVHYGQVFDPKHPFAVLGLQAKAYMAFNYEIWPGMEFELMYWEHMHRNPIVRHPFADVKGSQFVTMTWRVEDVHTEAERLRREFGLKPMYLLVSKSHTNPGIKGISRYKDIMFDTVDELGYYLRVSCRIPHEPWIISPKFSGVECNPYYLGHWDSIDAWLSESGQWIRQGWSEDGYIIPGYRGPA